ncbi:NPCBM/NEW2 domain-containing protein [Parabacteroides pacaensis]|uniref:NPCBM/NEW2 domain-containing protein n=1 Tax=Parabacteroides pacaensis TaxID=2086575 RepID=UPI000D1006DA|nr:NPCBM/NEW2 domain-containing protein [Parabacteroides pacaensis]
MKNVLTSLILVFVCFACGSRQTIYLSDMDISKMSSGWGTPKADSSITGKPLSIAGARFLRGVGTHAGSEMRLAHDRSAGTFKAMVGVDDHASQSRNVEFYVFTDKGVAFESGVMKKGDPAKQVAVDLKGVSELFLVVSSSTDGQDHDHADWADAYFTVQRPLTALLPEKESTYILTPEAPAEPRMNGAKVYGVTPGKPFLFKIAATGNKPMKYLAKGLPEGLHLDEKTGIITGVSPRKGEYKVGLTIANSSGECEDTLKIVSGEHLALTPPMGWNSWYIHMLHVTQKDMEEAAKAMVNTGLADYGYSFVNIDDGWNIRVNSEDNRRGGPVRNPDGSLRCNADFPDMKAFTDLAHSLGLKAGIYISPGTATCGGYAGSLHHEKQDARQFAGWGFDFLKYDWCSYGGDVKDDGKDNLYFKRPYMLMGELLKEQSRDVVFNLCQYGMDNVWEWGREVGGHCWRTKGDIGGPNLVDNMFSMGFFQGSIKEYSGPGGWNDPDYLLFGDIYDFEKGGHKKSDLSPSEQYTCMTLWCMLSAPLIFSGDITTLDKFTLNLLCNPELIAINQDEAGKSGYCIFNRALVEIWEKPLANGEWAVAVFNRRPLDSEITIDWEKLGYGSATEIRNLWEQRDVTDMQSISKLKMKRHGCMAFRMSNKNN